MSFRTVISAIFASSFLAFAMCANGIAAQTPSPKPAGNDLRAARATVQDIMEGKRVADTCARCHGGNGISATKGVPHLAGQRPAYLYNKLKAYQSGKLRHDESMEAAVKFLSDDALVKVAAYYGSLEPAPPLPATGKAPPPRTDPLAAGKANAASCDGCHGEGGVSKTAGMPNLVGLDPKYLVTAMKAYTNGHRTDEMMKSLVSPLTDSDMNSIALYYALQKPGKAQTPAKGDQAAGKVAAAACSGCHGDTGVSNNPANPSIAGQDAQYLMATLVAYKNGSRTEGSMKNAVAGLDEKTMQNLAAFYAAQQPQAPKVAKPMSTVEWAARCDRCHGINGNSMDVRTPAIAAQRVDYIEKALRAYKKGERKESVMSAMTVTLSDADIDALALHYARQRARSVVYVQLPPE